MPEYCAGAVNSLLVALALYVFSQQPLRSLAPPVMFHAFPDCALQLQAPSVAMMYLVLSQLGVSLQLGWF